MPIKPAEESTNYYLLAISFLERADKITGGSTKPIQELIETHIKEQADLLNS